MEGMLLYLFDDTHNLLPRSYDTLDIYVDNPET